jgi:AAA+ ATPase superfamily predicted ATPase
MSRKLRNKYGPWVTGDDFFNRDAEIRLLTERITGNDGNASGNNLLVVAPRRMGKTSLIRETFRRMEKNNSHYFIFLDIQNCSTPEDVMVALSMGAFKYQSLKKR